MIYLTGAGTSRAIRAAALASGGRLGYLATPAQGRRLAALADYRHWAADNGCYTAGAAFDLAGYLAWLNGHATARSRCLFAVAPDVVGDAAATWERSAPVLPLLQAMGFRAALVCQDGFDGAAVEWDAFDTLFMGGTTAFKLSGAAFAVAREAKRRGKWCHMGRVNSWRRLRAATCGGYDSADGTMLAFAPDKQLPALLRWLRQLNEQQSLPFTWEAQ